MCSVSENLKPQSQLNGAVLAFNYMTLALVLVGQAFFGYREWCVRDDASMPSVSWRP